MKKKSSLTEADVYEANRELVFMMCKNHGKSLEHEDRNAIASMGMLGAIRSYKSGLSTFEQHAMSCIRELLWEAESEQRRICRAELPFSLDKQLKNSDGSTKYIDMVAAFNEDSTSLIIVSDFIRLLERKLRCIVYLFIGGYTAEEVAQRMNMSLLEVEMKRKELSNKWTEYNQ